MSQEMKQYSVQLIGQTPLIMHGCNIPMQEKIAKWQKNPANKALSVKGDDRSPAWVWIAGLYHDGKHLVMESDNIMSMLRDGGAKLSTGKGKETFKKGTQSGIMLDGANFNFLVGGKKVPYGPIADLVGETDFEKHVEYAENNGFELHVKRVNLGTSRPIRVRAMFREWQCTGSLTVIDEAMSGLTKANLETILKFSGALCGLCDWRPNSPKSGQFGKFTVNLTEM